MRSIPGSYILSFLLPKGFDLPATERENHPRLDCWIRCTPPLLKVYGPSREAVFHCATDSLRAAVYDSAALPVSIAATLRSPPPVSGSDAWSIIVGADVAFSPTSLGAHFPRAATA